MSWGHYLFAASNIQRIKYMKDNYGYLGGIDICEYLDGLWEDMHPGWGEDIVERMLLVKLAQTFMLKKMAKFMLKQIDEVYTKKSNSRQST